MMIPFGLNPTGSLRSKKKPGKSELETYRQYGLVVDADGEKDLEFNTSWSVVDIDMWFWRLLPKAFEWLDARRGPLDIHWVLLNSDRLNLFILTQPTITGKELDEVKGLAGRSIMSHSIAIGMCSSSMPTMTVSNITGPAVPRIPISFTVYSNWDAAIRRSSHASTLAHRTQDILMISDSESDDLDDCHAGGTADEISDYSSDIAAPTRARKNKGKGKAIAVPINTLIKLTESDGEFQIVAGSAGPLTIKPTCYRAYFCLERTQTPSPWKPACMGLLSPMQHLVSSTGWNLRIVPLSSSQAAAQVSVPKLRHMFMQVR